jgi:hypothetical protein
LALFGNASIIIFKSIVIITYFLKIKNATPRYKE